MSTVFSITPSRNVHDINVNSQNGRYFIIDIYQENAVNYDSTVTVLDNISINTGSWLYKTTFTTFSANDNLKAAIEFIQKYLNATDASDLISDIHSPCNCSFVSEANQNNIASSLFVSVRVRIN